jgi:4-hydroxyphenylpyruvate dioxygenase
MSENFVVTQGVEYLEYAVKDLEASSRMYERLGFDCAGVRSDQSRRSKLYVQGDVRVILSASDQDSDAIRRFNKIHGDGVCNVGLRVESAEEAIRIACQRGAKEAHGLELTRGKGGAVQQRAAMHAYGDVLHTFVSYDGGRLADFFPEEAKAPQSGKGRYLQTVDHITVNVEKGRVNHWAGFFHDVFGMEEVRYFDIHTEKTGLFSRAMRSPNGRMTMPFNEPTEDKSQIQEFLDVFKGPGIQHIALHTSSITLAVDMMMKQGFEFLTVPASYYEAVPKRVPNVAEDMKELQRLGILVDGSKNGYLLQIFTQPLVGPFFFEVIQRKGDNGFGEGNFRALFEAIERDQMRRGVL